MPLFSNPARHRGINTGLHYSLLGGRITIGPDWKSVLGSLLIILAPTGIYFGFIAADNGANQSWALPAVIAALAAASIALLLTTAIMDPGFLPRNDDPVDTELGERPNSKEHEVRGYTVTTKWCVTCNHYRPPRCSHCAICDNCTRKFDHHCPWVGNCIGERNYRFFMAFLIVTTVLDALVHAFCWVRLVYITQHDDQPGFGEAIKREPAAIALIAYSFFAFGFVGGLSGLHTFFISTNRTTYEHFRARYGGSGNPYSRRCPGNWSAVCCTAIPPRYPENLVIPERTNGNAYGSVYDTQTSVPDSRSQQPRDLIIDSRASDHLGSDRQDGLVESGLGDEDGMSRPSDEHRPGLPGMASRSPGGDLMLPDQRHHPLQSSYPPPRQRGPVVPEPATYTSASGMSTEEGPLGSSVPQSPASSFEGHASMRSGQRIAPLGLSTPPSEGYGQGSGDEYITYSPHLHPEGLQLGQYGGNSSTGMSDEDDFVNTVPYEPQLAPGNIELQGYGPDAFGHTPALGRPQGSRQPDRQARGSRQDPVGSPLGPPTGPPVGYAEGPPVGTQGGPLSREPSQGRISREASQGRMSRERSWQGPGR